MQKSIQMPQILQKGCVLQRGNATRIWGWYKKGIKIEISFTILPNSNHILRFYHASSFFLLYTLGVQSFKALNVRLKELSEKNPEFIAISVIL